MPRVTGLKVRSIPQGPTRQDICAELVRLQKERAAVLKSSVMQGNRLVSVVAGTLGYESRMDEADREAKFDEARGIIKEVVAPNYCGTHPMKSFIVASQHGISALAELCDGLEKQMGDRVKQLPVSTWVTKVEQKGFGLIGLAKVVGECGDLSNYPNPAKVWKRMGCAPWTFSGPDVKYCEQKMGSTWRYGKEGKLPASEWELFGYSPRRRSIIHQISDGLVKQNGAGPYRARYVQAKVTVYTTHPEWDWKKCEKCKGAEPLMTTCPTCGGTGKKCMRAHLHGMLLAGKLLLKNLWIEWNK